MKSTVFLASHFSNLVLKAGLFYEWQPALRFELGDPHEQDELIYAKGSYDRAIELFEALHAPDDECIVVMDIVERNLKRRNLLPFIDQKFRFLIEGRSYIEDDVTFIRFEIACQVKDIAYVKLIRAIINEELGIKPSIPHRVYILNKHAKTIYHVYDDRGCDLLGSDKETLQSLYEQLNDWILDYDREAIASIFEG